MKVVRQITYEGSDKRVREVVNHSLPDGVCDFVDDPRIECKTLEGAPPDAQADKANGYTFGDRRRIDRINAEMRNFGDDEPDANAKRLHVMKQITEHFCLRCGAPKKSRQQCNCEEQRRA